MNQTPDAHTGRRTQGVTGAALGAVAKLGGESLQNVGAAQGNEESKKRKGPGYMNMCGRDFDLVRFGIFAERARNWLYDAKQLHSNGNAAGARMCVGYARKAGAMARVHYACALAAGKGVAA